MYSSKRSFEILDFLFWLHDGVVEDGEYNSRPPIVLTDIGVDGDYVFDPGCSTLLRKKNSDEIN